MLDTNQAKAVGLKYARSLQTLLKTAIMFSPGHAAVNQPLSPTHPKLNPDHRELNLYEENCD